MRKVDVVVRIWWGINVQRSTGEDGRRYVIVEKWDEEMSGRDRCDGSW